MSAPSGFALSPGLKGDIKTKVYGERNNYAMLNGNGVYKLPKSRYISFFISSETGLSSFCRKLEAIELRSNGDLVESVGPETMYVVNMTNLISWRIPFTSTNYVGRPSYLNVDKDYEIRVLGDLLSDIFIIALKLDDTYVRKGLEGVDSYKDSHLIEYKESTYINKHNEVPTNFEIEDRNRSSIVKISYNIPSEPNAFLGLYLRAFHNDVPLWLQSLTLKMGGMELVFGSENAHLSEKKVLVQSSVKHVSLPLNYLTEGDSPTYELCLESLILGSNIIMIEITLPQGVFSWHDLKIVLIEKKKKFYTERV